MSSEDDLVPAPAAQRPEVVDPHDVPILFVDWFVTGGINDGVVNITLGTIDHSMRKSDAEMARIVVATRLRLSQGFAARLHGALGDLLGISPPAGGHTPDPPRRPPNNTLN